MRLHMFMMKSPVFHVSFLEGPLSKLNFEAMYVISMSSMRLHRN